MSKIYHAGQRALQDRFDTRRLADRIEQAILRDRLAAEDRAFVERQVLFFLRLAAAGQRGAVQADVMRHLARLNAQYGHLNDLGRQRYDLRAAELSGMAAQAGIDWTPPSY
jgi:hypothetical protein